MNGARHEAAVTPRAMAAWVSLSVAAHAFALLALGARSADGQMMSDSGTASLRVRLAGDAVVVPVASTSPANRIGKVEDGITPARSGSGPNAGGVDVTGTSQGQPSSRSSPENAPEPSFSERRAVLLPVLAPEKFDAGRYRPSNELSVKPIPIGNIAVPYPETEAQSGVVKLKVTLYIDADGGVARVEADRSELPDAFSTAATVAFMRGRFKPGEVDGRATAARLRVEVNFEPTVAQRGRSRGTAGTNG